MKSPVLLLCIGCVAARDLDGDGVEGVAVTKTRTLIAYKTRTLSFWR